MDGSNAELENSGFLLHKLQELKNWQKQQEEQLLKEQQFQLDLLKQGAASNNNVGDDEDDIEDDTTIDQDLSSLHSEVVLPSWASHNSSSSNDNHAETAHHIVDDLPILPRTKTFEQMLEENLVNEKPALAPGAPFI